MKLLFPILWCAVYAASDANRQSSARKLLLHRNDDQQKVTALKQPFAYLPGPAMSPRMPIVEVPGGPPPLDLLNRLQLGPFPTQQPPWPDEWVPTVPPKGLEGWYATLPPELVSGWANGENDHMARYFSNCLGGPP